MKILVIGASGFVGRSVSEEVGGKHELIRAGRDYRNGEGTFFIDLLDKESIEKVLLSLRPDVIINAAGIVENTEHARLNEQFTENLLLSVHETGIEPKKIIISGSAAVYGIVNEQELPVKEETPMRATNLYGVSKAKEEETAFRLGAKHNLPVVVARIFNPVGKGMNSKFLISRVLHQLEEIKSGSRSRIEVSRLDACRDYVSVSDVARGIMAIIEGHPTNSVYNVGSGIATSNQRLVDIILATLGLEKNIELFQTEATPEPIVAIQADISRMKRDFNWEPKITLEETVGEIINDK